MSTTAVTPGAPAASIPPAAPAAAPATPPAATPAAEPQETSLQDQLNSASDEELQTWRRTGELPKAKTKTESESAGEAGDVNAAASAAATTPEKKPGQRTPAQSESRWAKLSRENRELRERLARAEGKAEGLETVQPREISQAPQPAAVVDRPEPKIDDLDAAGKPKYGTLAEYLSDVRKWDREQLKKEINADTAKTQREQQQAQVEQVIQRTAAERLEAARKTHADFDQVVASALDVKDAQGREVFFYEKGSHLDGFFLDSERGHDVMYHIASNPEPYKAIFARDANGKYKMNPVRQLRELTKIEAALEKTSPTPGATPNREPKRLPPPPTELDARRASTTDEAEAALQRGDVGAYMRAMNARELRARKG